MRTLLLFLSLSTCCQGAVIVANSVSYSDVSNAVASAHSGDTVQLPTGAGMWLTNLTVSGITLQGNGSNNTIIIDETPVNSSACPVITMQTTNGFLTRLSSLTVRNGVTNTFPFIKFSGNVQVSGTNFGLRIDHCFFSNLTGKPIDTFSQVNGLIDQNMFAMPAGQGAGGNSIEVDGSDFGDYAWSQPYSYGSSNALYIESNVFTSGNNFSAIDLANGAIAVIRDNAFMGTYISTHGTETGQRYRSVRAIEVYNNHFQYLPTFEQYENFFAGVLFRGGTGLIWSNTFVGFSVATGMQSFRATDNDPGFTPWFGATGFNGYDSNSATLLTSITTASGSTLVDSAQHWTTNQWVGYTVYNPRTYNGFTNCGLVVSSTATTMSFASSRSANSQIQFTFGDTYYVHYTYPNFDQVGRGQGDLVSGATPAAQWYHEALSPVYSWGNTLVQWENVPVNGNPDPYNEGYINIAGGRDYTNIALSGYTPLSYPYPAYYVPPTPVAPSVGLIGKLGRISNMH